MAGFLSCANVLIFVVAASTVLGGGMANKDWSFGNGFNYTNHLWGWGIHKNASHEPKYTQPPQGPNKIVVGGSEGWHYGFNYSLWAFKNGPYFINDTLVFKYDAPNSTTFPHSVYMFPNVWSYLKCDLKRAKMVGNWTQGSTGEGLELVLNNWKPYYFACGEHGGIHCRDGGMKFFVMPMLRWWHK